MKSRRARFVRVVIVTGATVVTGVLLALSVPTASAQPAGKKEHAFRGKIEKVDAKAKTLSVNGETVEGWMPAMTMTYGVDKEEVIKNVKVGDEITAKVHDGDFGTLYDVKVVPPKSKATPPKK